MEKKEPKPIHVPNLIENDRYVYAYDIFIFKMFHWNKTRVLCNVTFGYYRRNVNTKKIIKNLL